MESIVNFSFRSKTVFHSLPAVDPQTLPISKMELFMTIGNDLQLLIIHEGVFHFSNSFFFNPKYFYEMAICCIIVITGYNNTVLYKLNAFIKNNALWYSWK